jgi:hypothetical protein
VYVGASRPAIASGPLHARRFQGSRDIFAPLIAMELVKGQTVKENVEARPLKLDCARDVAIQTAHGLQAAHEKEGVETRKIKVLMLVGIVLSGALVSAGQTIQEPRAFFKEQIGLSDDQIATIDGGRAVVKTLPSKTPAEVFIFGATHVNAAPEDYLKFAFDMSRLRSLPSYLGVRRFSNPPTLSDLEGFTLEPGDIKNLKDCRPGKCDVQVSREAMLQLQKAVDWSAPDVAKQVNERVRKMALEVLVRYQERGNSALEIYHDKSPPFNGIPRRHAAERRVFFLLGKGRLRSEADAAP